jgi:hypothetical protein
MKTSTVFLQAVTVLVGLGALAFLLGMPQIEGRNAHATQFQIYFNDPFLAYAYTAAIPFFVVLWKAFTVLGYARQDRVFSPEAVAAARTAKLCGLAMIGFVVGGEILLLSGVFGAIDPSDDRAGGVAMGVMIGFGSAVIAATAATLERTLQKAVEMKAA